MEMKQISETTLKITISMEDLEERGMELKDFLIPQEKTEEFFYSVMDELDLPDNFKDSGMLSFRVTPRKDRIDVFVTKSEINKEIIPEIIQTVTKNPRITLWSIQSASVLRYLRKTRPEFSITKEASLLIDEAIREKYPEIWKFFEEIE